MISIIFFIFLCILQKFPNKYILILWTSPIIPVIKWYTFEQNLKSGLNRRLTTGWMTSSRWYIRKFMKNYSFPIVCIRGFPGSSVVNNLPANARAISGSGRSPGEGNGNPFQDSCLGNPMDRCLVGYRPWGTERVKHDWTATTDMCKSFFLALFWTLFFVNFKNDILGTIMRFTI